MSKLGYISRERLTALVVGCAGAVYGVYFAFRDNAAWLLLTLLAGAYALQALGARWPRQRQRPHIPPPVSESPLDGELLDMLPYPPWREREKGWGQVLLFGVALAMIFLAHWLLTKVT